MAVTLPDQLQTLVTASAPPPAKEAAPAKASAKPTPTSTELLQQVLDKEKGKKTESFTSKLTDTDTLARFVLGVAAMASGDTAGGAGLMGMGLMNANAEATRDNKVNEAAVKELELQQVDFMKQREDAMFLAGMADPAMVVAAGSEFDRAANTRGDFSLYSTSVQLEETRRNREMANTLWQAMPQIKDKDKRAANAVKIINLLGVHDVNGEMSSTLASDNPNYDWLMQATAAQSTEASVITAGKLFAVNHDVAEYMNTLVPANPKGSGTAADLAFNMKVRVMGIYAKANKLVQDGKYNSAEQALVSDDFTPEEQALYQAFGETDDVARLRSLGQNLFDPQVHNSWVKYWTDQGVARNENYRIDGKTDKIKPIEDIVAEAEALANLSSAMGIDNILGMSDRKTEAALTTVAGAVGRALGKEEGVVDPETMQATAAAIIQVKKELLAENPDIEQDPNFKSIVVDRVLVNLGERAPGEVTLPVVAKPKATKPSPLDVPEYHTAPERVYDTITGAGQALADGVKSITNNGVTFPKPKKDEPTVVAAQPKATAASATAAKKDFDDADKEARAALAKFRAAKPGTTEYKEAKAALDRAGRKRALAGQKMQQALGEPTDAPVQKDTTTAGPTPAELTQGAINTGAATAAVGATNAIAELPAVREKVVKLLDGMIATDHFAEINTQMEQKYVDFVASVNAAPSTEVRTALKAADKEATRLAKENERVAGIKRELAAGDVSNRVALQKQLKVAVEDSLETEARMQRNLALARSIYTLATGRR